jgi:hypothetical protein
VISQPQKSWNGWLYSVLDVRVKLSLLECPYNEITFIAFQPNGLKFTEETRKVFHLEQRFLCWWNLHTLESSSEKTGKFWNVMLGKDVNDHLGRSFEKWRRIAWIKEQGNILHTVKRRKANWIGHILRVNCLLNNIIEGTIEEWIGVTERWERRCKQLLDNFKEKRVCYKLKKEAIDRTELRTRIGRNYGRERQIAGWKKYIVLGQHEMSKLFCPTPETRRECPQKTQ